MTGSVLRGRRTQPEGARRRLRLKKPVEDAAVLERVRVVCVPAEPVFEAEVAALLDDLGTLASSRDELAAAIVGALRGRYPAIRLRSRDPIARYSSEQATWHVYRDGRSLAEDTS
jgi:hypothetical protein